VRRPLARPTSCWRVIQEQSGPGHFTGDVTDWAGPSPCSAEVPIGTRSPSSHRAGTIFVLSTFLGGAASNTTDLPRKASNTVSTF
jgi:hypothetical protein